MSTNERTELTDDQRAAIRLIATALPPYWQRRFAELLSDGPTRAADQRDNYLVVGRRFGLVNKLLTNPNRAEARYPHRREVITAIFTGASATTPAQHPARSLIQRVSDASDQRFLETSAGTSGLSAALGLCPISAHSKGDCTLDEVAIVDRVQVDVGGIPEFGHHAAIPAAEPLDVVIRDKKTKREHAQAVYGFTADGRPLVLDRQRAKLVPVSSILTADQSARIEARSAQRFDAVGPFTPAPTGMVALFSDGRRLPIVYYDVHGRAVCMDDGNKSRELFTLDEDDEGLTRIEGYPA